MFDRLRTASCAAAALALLTGPARAEIIGAPWDWGITMQRAGTLIQEKVSWFNSYTFWIILAISVFVLVLLGYAILKFNHKSHPTPSRTTHNTLLEVAWTVVPIFILLAIAIPSFQLLYGQYDPSKFYEDYDPDTTPMLTVKATGYQWYWGYEYAAGEEGQAHGVPADSAISFDSLMLADAELEEGDVARLSVDNPVVVPVDTFVRMQITSADVIHSWAMPSFGWKMDAIPGRLNESYFKADKEGIYFGQCSELCGHSHAFMPIEVHVVSKDQFAAWAQLAADDVENANRQLALMIERDRERTRLAQR